MTSWVCGTDPSTLMSKPDLPEAKRGPPRRGISRRLALRSEEAHKLPQADYPGFAPKHYVKSGHWEGSLKPNSCLTVPDKITEWTIHGPCCMQYRSDKGMCPQTRLCVYMSMYIYIINKIHVYIHVYIYMCVCIYIYISPQARRK